MKQIDLDALASKWVDAIKYRQEAATVRMQLAEAEQEAVKAEKSNLIAYLISTNGVDPNKQNVQLNARDKKFIIEDKA